MQNEHINFNIARTSLGAPPGFCAPIAYTVYTVFTRQSTSPLHYIYVSMFSQCSIGIHCHFVFFRLGSPLRDAVDPDTSFFVALVLAERVLSLRAKQYDTRTNTQCH